MRKLFLIVGALLAVIVAAGIFLLWRASRPVVYELPVAVTDIPAGTVLRPQLFKVVQWSNLDEDTLRRLITVDEFDRANGKTTLTDIRAGFPVAESQVDPNSNAEGESRLSQVISGTKTSYIVMPVNPDMIGNYVQPGDRVDVLVSIGDLSANEFNIGPDGELLVQDKTQGSGAADAYKPALVPPMSKLILQNMRIIRIDREVPRDQNNNATDEEAQRAREVARRVADVKRLYIEVTRDQYEVLSFVLNNGKRNIAVRAATGDTVIEPTEGVTWNDFVRWFYIQRGKEIQADSFRKVGPYEAAPQE